MVHGSFTGIRIGISTVKAFKDSLNIKTVGINSLEGLAYNVASSGIICSIIDAKKQNVYVEVFENIGGKYKIKRNPSFENIDDLLNELKLEKLENITFVGDGAANYQEKILQILPDSIFCLSNQLFARNIGLAALDNVNLEYTTSLEPLYLRKSQAEQVLCDKSQLNERTSIKNETK